MDFNPIGSAITYFLKYVICNILLNMTYYILHYSWIFVSQQFVCLVGTGGLLFEYYILGHAKDTDYNLLYTAIHSNQIFTRQQRRHFVLQYSLLFWFDTIRQCHHLNQQCTRPLAFWTMLEEYRGLSTFE